MKRIGVSGRVVDQAARIEANARVKGWTGALCRRVLFEMFRVRSDSQKILFYNYF
ncbi:MAG: hypothetical protein K2X50_03735 [Gammaproteobacteria bacterium]|nr:hypothetical protein [Gammaproteobacteria bacterium]